MIDAIIIEKLFNSLFSSSHKTLLCGGAAEPIYYPISEHEVYARIFYRHDYVASALHEIAHWVIAGEKRRKHIDYGYWYEADGRDTQQQKAFFLAESKPQALEAIFSESLNLSFTVSLDNINAQETHKKDQALFEQAVNEQKKMYLANMPARANMFNQCLLDYLETRNASTNKLDIYL